MTAQADLWGVYLLRCADGSFYCGIAKDVRKRLAEHNLGTGGAKYTRSRRPVELLLFTGAVFSRSLALQLERRVKTLPRPEKPRMLLRLCAV